MPKLKAPAIQDECGASARLTIDLKAVQDNWLKLASFGQGATCGAVVKANGYGLGYEAVMQALYEVGCRIFFIATIAEGEAARKVFPSAKLYVFDGIIKGGVDRLIAAQLEPVIGSLEELDDWLASGYQQEGKLKAALHFDTGMNRLGFSSAEAEKIAKKIQGYAPSLIMSHFVNSQIADSPLNTKQISSFNHICQFFPGVPASMANSSAIFMREKPFYDVLRPGYALYGGNPTPFAPNPMRNALKLEARILTIRDLALGETVGYDALWTAKRPSRIATLGIGYADGIHISASAGNTQIGGEAYVAGVICPFIGRVSMDYLVIDITNTPHALLKRGDWVELLGDTITIDDLAKRSGVIGYEVLTRLGMRYARRYLKEELGAGKPGR
jgi:alanine racemase